MEAILFRKIVYNDTNYYQLFKVDNDFEYDPLYVDFNDRALSDYFYIENDGNIEIPDPKMFNIYSENNGKLQLVTDEELQNILMNGLSEKYNFIIRKRKPIREVINRVKEKVYFQDNCVSDLVGKIYLNQAVVVSDLPVELKITQKSNIFFHGIKGSGKKTIIECLEKELDIPYVDVSVSLNVKDIMETIITGLLEQSNNDDEASHGIVFIRDNFNELTDKVGNKLYDILNHITSQGIIHYGDNVIDFRTITFVVLCDEYDKDEVEYGMIQAATNCEAEVSTKELTDEEKYMILVSKVGRLHYYEKFINQYGKKLIIDDDSLMKIIHECSLTNPSMNYLNLIIDTIVKLSMQDNRINDVYIDNECYELLRKILQSRRDNNSKTESQRDDDFSFEKTVDEVVAKVKEDVINQDRCVRMLTYQLVDNLRNAYNDNLRNPKNRIMNILVRGNSGNGKTFLIETVLKNLGVPYFTADATEYTATGWVGNSVNGMLVGLLNAAGGDQYRAERGVLVIDEADKKAAAHNSYEEGPGRVSVQEALYKLAEGSIIEVPIGDKGHEKTIYFNTSRLTILLGGAFENIEQYRDERLGLRQIGFGNQDTTGKDLSIIPADYIRYGMTKQFMRRVNEIIELDEFTEKGLINVMKKSNSSALIASKINFDEKGIELVYSEDFYSAVATKALELKEGVGGIKNILIKVLQSINYQDIRPSEIRKIILNADVINDPSKVILVPRSKRKTKKLK